MTKLNDLNWKPHLGGEWARITFPNRYCANVLRGGYPPGKYPPTYQILALDYRRYLDRPANLLLGCQSALTEAEAEVKLAAIEALPEDMHHD